MRGVAVLLTALFLVNLPFAHQAWTDREIARSGRDVEATVLDARHVGGSFLVDYRLPGAVDPARRRFSARVDEATFEQAQRSEVLLVRVVPGKPAASRPVGSVESNLFAVVAALGDGALLLVALLGWRRWRRRSVHLVVEVPDRADPGAGPGAGSGADDEVTLESRRGRLTVAVPRGWVRRVRVGDRVGGRLHLVTDDEVLPAPDAGAGAFGFEQVHGASYVVRGRVADARTGAVVLEVGDGFRLRVQTGGRRIRADIRDSAQVRGTLCFTPGLWPGADSRRDRDG